MRRLAFACASSIALLAVLLAWPGASEREPREPLVRPWDVPIVTHSEYVRLVRDGSIAVERDGMRYELSWDAMGWSEKQTLGLMIRAE